jgi:hypothetical protein
MCRVAEGLLQGLFPRDAHKQPAAAPKRFKGMLKVRVCAVVLSCAVPHAIPSMSELEPSFESQHVLTCACACAAVLQVVNPPACTALVSCQEFHLPLIECALHLVNFITAPQQQVSPCTHPRPWHSVHGMQHNMFGKATQ